MKKILILLIIFPFFLSAQDVVEYKPNIIDSLNIVRDYNLREGWTTFSIGIFAYAITSTNLMYGSSVVGVYTPSIKNKNSYLSMIPFSIIGIGFDILSIKYFVKAKKLKKLIKIEKTKLK